MKYSRAITDEYIQLIKDIGFEIEEQKTINFSSMPKEFHGSLKHYLKPRSKVRVFKIGTSTGYSAERLAAYTALRMVYIPNYRDLVGIILNLHRLGLSPAESMVLGHNVNHFNEFDKSKGFYYKFLVNTYTVFGKVRYHEMKEGINANNGVNLCLAQAHQTNEPKYVKIVKELEELVSSGQYKKAIKLWKNKPKYKPKNKYSRLKQML